MVEVVSSGEVTEAGANMVVGLPAWVDAACEGCASAEVRVTVKTAEEITNSLRARRLA